MNFKEWKDKYYPNEDKEILHKMSHAWAAGHANIATGRQLYYRCPKCGVHNSIGSSCYLCEHYEKEIK